MKLRPRLLVTAAIAAIPAAALAFLVNESLRTRDMQLALDRFVSSQMTDDFRERCESNPNWFIAGPRPDRPTPQQLAAPDADVTAPRPPTQQLPFEFFAYDDGFQPLSTAGPRFPADMRQALRSGTKRMTTAFATPTGTGQQEAVLTGWFNSPCVALLFRMRPVPHQRAEQTGIAVGLAALFFAVAIAAGFPLTRRVRQLAAETRRSAHEEYGSTVAVAGHDELSSAAFAFNEAAAGIRQRSTDIKDREDSLRRYLAATREEVATPLLALEQQLSSRPDLNALVSDAHTVAMRLHNLAAAATLKMSAQSGAKSVVDLDRLVEDAVKRQQPFARASGVTVEVKAERGIRASADAALLEHAIENLVDNGIRYNRTGGRVMVSLDRTRDGRFSLRVSDDGPGAPDDVLAKLNANRRFRGDEGRSQRGPGDLGLGLAIVREAADRMNMKWSFRRSASEGFEAEITGDCSFAF
jgi:signal transduction histidine kinase